MINIIKSFFNKKPQKITYYNIVDSFGRILYKEIPENIAINYCLICNISNEKVVMVKI